MKTAKWLILFLVLFSAFIYWELYAPASDSTEPVFVAIAQRESFNDIVRDLKQKGLIRSEIITRWYARLAGLDTKIHAGRFRLDPSYSPVRILRFLERPEYGEISVTIPEGFSIFDIDKKLTSLDLIQEDDFITWSLNADASRFSFITNGIVEGFLFPDTYFVFAKNFRPQDLGNAMLANFEKKVVTELSEEIQKSNKSLREITTMASILEKEAMADEDFPTISGILWKRLANNWPLQADATILYGRQNREVSRADLDKDSSYNTYTRMGLPPTPIGNPGLRAIRASLNPTESEYWFYLTDINGKAVYARTNEEHEQNKQKFL